MAELSKQLYLKNGKPPASISTKGNKANNPNENNFTYNSASQAAQKIG